MDPENQLPEVNGQRVAPKTPATTHKTISKPPLAATSSQPRQALRDLNLRTGFDEPHPRTIIGLKRRLSPSATGNSKPAVRSKLQYESSNWLDRLDSLPDSELPPIEFAPLSEIDREREQREEERVREQVAQIVAKLGMGLQKLNDDANQVESLDDGLDLAPILSDLRDELGELELDSLPASIANLEEELAAGLPTEIAFK